MADPGTPQFWSISFPFMHDDGTESFLFDMGVNERHARDLARMWSLSNGYATITNHEGLVATYVSGREWWPNRTSEDLGHELLD